MISKEMLRSRKGRTELGIKKYEGRLLKSTGPGERKSIKLRIAEDKEALKRIEEALEKFNVPAKRRLANKVTIALLVKNDSTIKHGIAEDKEVPKRIEEPLKNVNIPGNHYSGEIASATPAVKKEGRKRRRKPKLKTEKDLFALKE